MLLSEVELENFKGVFTRQRIGGLRRVNTLIGRNNGGKTSLLEALWAVRDSLVGGQVAEDMTTLLPFREADRVMRIRLTFELEQEEYQQLRDHLEVDLQPNITTIPAACTWEFVWEPSLGTGNRLLPTSCTLRLNDRNLTVWVADSAGDLRAARWDEARSFYVSRRQGLVLQLHSIGSVQSRLRVQGPNDAAQFGMNLALGFAQKLRFRRTVRVADDRSPASQNSELDEQSKNISQVLLTLKNNEAQVFERIENTLCRILPEVRGLSTPLEGTETALKPALEASRLEKHAFYLSEMGFGTQQVLALLTTIFCSPSGSLVLIEEPEICLHADAQRSLASFLVEYSKKTNTQFIMTTHSPIFAPQGSEGATYLVKWDQENGTTYSRVREGEASIIKRELGWRNADLFMKDGVVFWEGESEDAAMPILIDALGYGERMPAIASISLRGSVADRLRVLREFLRYLQGSDLKPFVFSDDDEHVATTIQNLIAEGLLPQLNYHIWGRSPGNLSDVLSGLEFEDNFQVSQLIEAANAQAAESGQAERLTTDGFRKSRQTIKTKKKTSKALNDYFHNKVGRGLDKPTLNKALALMVARELRNEMPRSVQTYEFKGAIKDLFDVLYPVRKGEAEQPEDQM
ncbi:MAG: AAA family ATPase [Chloroflexi bacterium]|nr:AAA family ATPase [Chloroflexota bacterium]